MTDDLINRIAKEYDDATAAACAFKELVKGAVKDTAHTVGISEENSPDWASKALEKCTSKRTR